MSTPRAQVEKIALFLGQPWKFNYLGEPSPYWFEIIDGAGHALQFRVEGKHFKVSGHFPRSATRPWPEDHQTIGLSLTRCAKAAAADIARRLIPHYLDAYAKAAQRYRAEQAQQERLSYIAHALVKVTAGKMTRFGRGALTVDFKQGTADIWTKETIDLTLWNLSIDQAIQIASLLQAKGRASDQG